jgi:hypothetical protein
LTLPAAGRIVLQMVDNNDVIDFLAERARRRKSQDADVSTLSQATAHDAVMALLGMAAPDDKSNEHAEKLAVLIGKHGETLLEALAVTFEPQDPKAFRPVVDSIVLSSEDEPKEASIRWLGENEDSTEYFYKMHSRDDREREAANHKIVSTHPDGEILYEAKQEPALQWALIVDGSVLDQIAEHFGGDEDG